MSNPKFSAIFFTDKFSTFILTSSAAFGLYLLASSVMSILTSLIINFIVNRSTRKLEEETKSKRPFKIFKKSYKKWEDLINLIHVQQNENNKRYMDSLKDLEELIDIRLDLKMNN